MNDEVSNNRKSKANDTNYDNPDKNLSKIVRCNRVAAFKGIYSSLVIANNFVANEEKEISKYKSR